MIDICGCNPNLKVCIGECNEIQLKLDNKRVNETKAAPRRPRFATRASRFARAARSNVGNKKFSFIEYRDVRSQWSSLDPPTQIPRGPASRAPREGLLRLRSSLASLPYFPYTTTKSNAQSVSEINLSVDGRSAINNLHSHRRCWLNRISPVVSMQNFGLITSWDVSNRISTWMQYVCLITLWDVSNRISTSILRVIWCDCDVPRAIRSNYEKLASYVDEKLAYSTHIRHIPLKKSDWSLPVIFTEVWLIAPDHFHAIWSASAWFDVILIPPIWKWILPQNRASFHRLRNTFNSFINLLSVQNVQNVRNYKPSPNAANLPLWYGTNTVR